MRWVLFLYPWLELWSLIELGGQTTPLISLGWVLAMLMLGGAMVRWAGRNSLQRLAHARSGGMLVQQLVLTDFALILSGLLLAIPGLISDCLALLIWIKPLRLLLVSRWRPQASVFQTVSPGRGGPGDIIEGDYEVTDSSSPGPSSTRDDAGTRLNPPN
ncbi:MAG: FxsA family protein [Luminiphilus sp.]